jgi:predicted amidohydrolase
MKIRIAQLGVRQEVAANKERMLAVLDSAHRHEWVIFPEGILSGYFPEEDDFVKSLDADAIERGIHEIQREVERRQCHCLFGAATLADRKWRNSVVLLSGSEERYTYHKVELSVLDRKHFTPGTKVSPYSADGLKIGIQACRELLFPQSWLDLKKEGAQVVFHINNAIKPHDQVWEHILIARAVEHGIFVCSVNNGSHPQALASYLIAPSGRAILRTETRQDQILSAEINLSEVIADLARRTDY